jgi:hypothetical protein
MTSAVVVRVGGVAAAVGAGVVIGLALAAPASADRADTGSGGSADSQSTSAPRRALGTPAAERPSGIRAPRPAATVRAAKSAATVTRRPAPKPDVPPKTIPVASEPVAVQPLPAAAVGGSRREARPAVTASAPLSAPTASTTRLSGLATASAAPATGWFSGVRQTLQSIFGCDPRGRLITIYKGTHFAIPNNFGFFLKKVSGTGTFTPDTVYDLQDEDQYDWNKFTGIAFTPLEPDRNSAMVGWRYNLTSQQFEIAPFYNVDKQRILPNELTEVISVPANETFNYLVDYTGITVNYGDATVFKAYPEGLTPNVWTAARVSGWFGGNEVAPRTLSYYIKFA